MKHLLAIVLLPLGASLWNAPAAVNGPDRDAHETPDPKAVGSVVGTVVFPGKPPQASQIRVDSSKKEQCHPGGTQMDMRDRSLLVAENGGIANVVVSIKVPGAEVRIPPAPLVLNNQTCRFEPHVLVVPVGGTVRFANSDGTSHNVHTFSKRNVGINKTVASKTSVDHVFKRSEVFSTVCDIHSWMKSWIFVTDTPFVSVTDEQGRFRIDSLPPGTYQAKLWHEHLGKLKAEITVVAGQPTQVKWEMSQKKKRRR